MHVPFQTIHFSRSRKFVRWSVHILKFFLLCFVITAGPLFVQSAHATTLMSHYSLQASPSQVRGIVTGPDNALWFTDSDANSIGRMTTSGGITYYALPTNDAVPTYIAAGSDGALWFTESNANNIGRITTSGAITEYSLPTSTAAPWGITSGPDGALWFTEEAANAIGRITTSGTITEFSLPSTVSTPYSITTGSDGALWFTESGDNNIGRITTSGSVTGYAVASTGVGVYGIAAGSDGALWFSEQGQITSDGAYENIGRITTSGTTSFYGLPTNAAPTSITAGHDNALWFTDGNSNGPSIGRITTSGVVEEYSTPTSALPWSITAGPDNALWFTEDTTNSIGRIINIYGPGTLSISSPTKYPALSWSSAFGATSYKIYRNSTFLISTTGTSYTDNTASEGTNSYYVTTVNGGGESAPGNNVSVLVDRTAPSATYSLSPTPNTYGWNNATVTVSFSCSDNSGGSGMASCSSPISVSNEGASQSVTGTATDNAGNSATTTATVNVDKTAPTASSLTLSSPAVVLNQTITITANAADSLSGVAKGEFYVDTDPGQGNGTAMTYASGQVSASSTFNLSVGTHTIFVRTQDKAGNWSTTVSQLFVYL